MILHCKEFDVNSQKIIMGHDRETGKRYYLTEITEEKHIQDLPWYLTNSIELVNTIKPIFWIE